MVNMSKVPPFLEEVTEITTARPDPPFGPDTLDEKILFDRDVDSPGDEEKNGPALSSSVATSADGDRNQPDFSAEEFAKIPELVREVVSFDDDPSLLVITFRSVVLSLVFCAIGSFVSQLS